MEIKTKPATAAYVDNFDKIFNRDRDDPKQRYRVPVDVFIYATSLKDVEEQLEYILYNVDYELPVGYPTDVDILT